MRGHVVAVHVPRRDGEDDEHEQVYEDPDGLEHLAQHRPPSVPPVLVRAEGPSENQKRDALARKERLSRKDESTTRALWRWGTRRWSVRARVARAKLRNARRVPATFARERRRAALPLKRIQSRALKG